MSHALRLTPDRQLVDGVMGASVQETRAAGRPEITEPVAELLRFARREPPTGAVARNLSLSDGTVLRTARWPARVSADAIGTVLICTGRGEFIEKYFETVEDLLARGFAVTVFDWRGQGLSTRPLYDPRKGHVASFELYLADLQAVIGRVLEPFCPKPFFALAHSMGGTVMLHHARRRGCAFERIVLSAPMVEIANLPAPTHLRRLVTALSAAGFGQRFLPQGRRTSVFEKGFPGNVLTSDPGRFADMLTTTIAEPRLSIGPPTIGWLHAAFDAMAPFADPAFAKRLRAPVLMVVPGGDRVISVSGMERFGRGLKVGRSITVAHAQHEILMERAEFRDQFWAAFDAFVPGTPAAIGVEAPSRSV